MKTANRYSAKLRWIEVGLLLGAVLILATGIWSLRTQQELSDKVVRLHVLANSDSEEDQALKLRVRDRILERTTALLEDSADRRAAEGILRGQLLELEKLAAEEITAAGYDYPVSAELTHTGFPTREYDGFTLPAGEYLALRIVIGQGGGRNWWCVVFPPLCTTAASELPDAAMQAGLSGEEVRLITEQDGYVLKLRAVEFWEELKAHWNA